MEAELAELLPSSRSRAVYLRLDDARLAGKLEILRAQRDRVRRIGHIAAAGVDLRIVEEPAGG